MISAGAVASGGMSPTNGVMPSASRKHSPVTIEARPVRAPAATPAAIIDDIVERYRSLAPARILFTKLDEVEVAPELSRAPARHGLPVSWVTTGQAVPEDIEEPTSARVQELATAGLARTRTQAA